MSDDETTPTGPLVACTLSVTPKHYRCMSAIPRLRWVRRRTSHTADKCTYHNQLQAADQCSICGKIVWTDVPMVDDEEPRP
jgi:hypothetical protein